MSMSDTAAYVGAALTVGIVIAEHRRAVHWKRRAVENADVRDADDFVTQLRAMQSVESWPTTSFDDAQTLATNPIDEPNSKPCEPTVCSDGCGSYWAECSCGWRGNAYNNGPDPLDDKLSTDAAEADALAHEERPVLAVVR